MSRLYLNLIIFYIIEFKNLSIIFLADLSANISNIILVILYYPKTWLIQN